jgi:hypothetical protein
MDFSASEWKLVANSGRTGAMAIEAEANITGARKM